MNSSKELIPIVTTLDAIYLQHCAVMLSSLFSNNSMHTFRIYLILSFEENTDLQKLRNFVAANNHQLIVLKIDDKQIKVFQTLHHITTATYYRLLIPNLITADLSKILYLDVDVIIKKDIYPLWQTPLDDYSLAAVKEPLFNRHSKLEIPSEASYFNAGVMLINLAKWRKNQVSKKLLEFMMKKNGSLDMLEQDALNAVLYNEWVELPIQWNVSTAMFTESSDKLGFTENELSKIIQQPGIIHYTGFSKPWHYLNKHPLKREYYIYLQFTPWQHFKHPEETIWHKLKQSCKQLVNFIYGRKKFEIYN